MGDRSPFAAGYCLVELYYGGTWHDVSADLSADGARITRGRGDESARTDPATANLALHNPTGTYSPRNPNSPLYGLIGRNTPIRVTTNHTGVLPTVTERFHGEVTEWPQRWGKTGSPSAYTPIVASGILRRLGQGGAALRSPLYRVLSTIGSDLVAYWPLEDGSDATQYAPAVTAGYVMGITGTPSGAAYDGFVASDSLPTLQDARLYAPVRAHAGTGEAQVRMMVRIPTGAPTASVLLRVRCTGTLGRVDVRYNGATSLFIEGFNSAGASVGSAVWGFGTIGGKKLRLSLELDQSGADVLPALVIYEVGAPLGVLNSGTFAGVTLGSVSSVEINPSRAAFDDVAIGHVTVEKAITPLGSVSAQVLLGYAGEDASERFQRLCGEEGVDSTVVLDGGLTPSEPMGPQRSGAFLDLLNECVDTGGGVLVEPRADDGLWYRTLPSQWSQTPKLALAYQDNLVRPFEPTDDDQATRNLVTVTRAGGSSATVEQTTGPLSTQAPPAGVGVYSDSVELSLYTDDQATRHAQWRVARGTVDEARWPTVGFDLADAPFLADAALTEAVLAVDVGDLVEISDPPPWLPPGTVRGIVQGVAETIEPLHHRIEFGLAPASPYDVAKYTSTHRYNGAGTELDEALTTTETGVDVRPPTGVVWSHANGDFDVTVGGEVMTVTAVGALSSGVQTLTVVRSVNGVVKTHSIGDAVQLARPARYGL